MAEKVKIYGKDTWGYTRAAREDFGKRGFEVEYVNLKASPDKLPEFLGLSGGGRRVPLIVDPAGKVTIGFGGTWGV